MHKKDFDKWNEQKKKIHHSDLKDVFVKDREIWFCRMGENIGFEEDGKGDEFLRPVLVYKKFSKDVFLGIPLTTKEKKNIFHFSFEFKGKISTAILSQIRLFDKKRLKYKIGRVSPHDFENIKKKLIELIQ